jgi:arginine deiminase
VSAALPVSVRSEVGPLRTVLLHRPSREVERITPSNMDQLLFDELLWVEHAQQEHDAFADLLRSHGVEVLYLERLLADVLADGEVARAVVERHVTDRTCGPQAVGRVRELLLDNEPTELVEHLIGGVTVGEVGRGDGLVTAVSDPNEMLLAPLPNAVFMRDSSAWIGEGVVLSPMNRLVRRRETDLLRTIYALHPRFAHAPVWFGGEVSEYFPATFEGGDCSSSATVGSRSASRSAPPPPAWRPSRPACSTRGSSTACWPSTCRRSATRCTSTRSSPRWTSTRSSPTRR